MINVKSIDLVPVNIITAHRIGIQKLAHGT